MTKFEAPVQGSLDNPNWTEKQNRDFDRGQNWKTGAQARHDALGGEDDVAISDASEAAQRTLQSVPAPSSSRESPVEEGAAAGKRLDQEITYKEKEARRAEEEALRTAPDPEVTEIFHGLSGRYGSGDGSGPKAA